MLRLLRMRCHLPDDTLFERLHSAQLIPELIINRLVLIEVEHRKPKNTVSACERGASMSKENPLRPRSRRSPKRILSEAELQRYGLRRISTSSRNTPPKIEGRDSIDLKRGALLVWNGPAMLLSRLARVMRLL